MKTHAVFLLTTEMASAHEVLRAAFAAPQLGPEIDASSGHRLTSTFVGWAAAVKLPKTRRMVLQFVGVQDSLEAKG